MARITKTVVVETVVCDRCAKELDGAEAAVAFEAALGNEWIRLPELCSKCARTVRNALSRIGLLPDLNGTTAKNPEEIPAQIEQMPGPDDNACDPDEAYPDRDEWAEMETEDLGDVTELRDGPVGLEAGAGVDDEDDDSACPSCGEYLDAAGNCPCCGWRSSDTETDTIQQRSLL